ncbi:helix-turn-helix domain-containing protein [Chryseobacterium sp. WG14]|uniref:helix-turn-helix domain-containing protein n=1 Tax=Chryseobacterium sp. WG14 TaxID=2926909 RepID=UPI00211F3029|nr:helix-turn-helix domain-containing protein [Chryseobacterium sp. WG14]MCQ9638094.1 helix-turn-helix domain-containing protein [Chryseobacterium sp. WG14]
MKKKFPDYNKIYTDILVKKFPHKYEECQSLLQKEILSALDIITLNKKIFGRDISRVRRSQKHRSYSKSDILEMLDYQKKHKFNNSQLARHFYLSRNSVMRWKKMFCI